MEKLTSGKKTRKKISFASEKERKTEETRRISLNVMDRFARTRHRQTRTQTKEREREKGEREREREKGERERERERDAVVEIVLSILRG